MVGYFLIVPIETPITNIIRISAFMIDQGLKRWCCSLDVFLMFLEYSKATLMPLR